MLQRKELYKNVSLCLEGLPKDPYTEWKYEMATTILPMLSIDGRWLRHLPKKISFTATNMGNDTMHLHLAFDELSWEAVDHFTGKRHQIAQAVDIKPGETCLCEYDMRLITNADTHDPSTPVMPLSRMVIMAAGSQLGKQYHLQLRDLVITYPNTRDVKVTSFTADDIVTAGKPWKMKLQMSGQWPTELSLEWRLGDYTNWRVMFDEHQLLMLRSGREISLDVPEWLKSGKYQAVICGDGYHVSQGSHAVEVRNTRRPGYAQMSVRKYNGRNVAFRNGKPIQWQGWASYDFQPGPVRQFGRRGCRMFIVPVAAGQHLHHQVAYPTNPLPGEYDYGQLHERVGFCLQTSPDSMVMLRISLTPPPYWVQQYEKERAIVSLMGHMTEWEETGTAAISIASKAWIEYQTDMLRRLLEECRTAPWADRLVGVFLSAEVTEEWFAWGCNDSALADYSLPFNNAWRKWKQQNHRNDLPDTIAPPDARVASKDVIQPNTDDGRWSAATAQFMSDITAEVIVHFSKAAKKFTDRKLLVATLYGYLIQLAGEARQYTSGHFGVRQLLDSPDIDSIAGIPLLSSRTYARGSVTSGEADASYTLAGKIHMMENDLFSWRHPGGWYTEYNHENPRLGAIDMHQRVAAAAATEGYLEHKFGLACSWHHDSLLMNSFAQNARITYGAVELDRTSVSEVAMLVDDRSMSVSTLSPNWLWETHRMMVHTLNLTGAPIETYLLSDADKLPERIKYVVVASGISADAATLNALRRLMSRGRVHVLALGPIGLVDSATGKWLKERPAELFGLPIKLRDEEVLVAAIKSNQLEVLPQGNYKPRAEVPNQGEWAYLDGCFASAVRALPNGGKLTWVGSAPTNSEWQRSQFKAADVHLYAPEGYSVHASKQLLAVTAPVDGEAEITLRLPAKATDLFTNWQGSGGSLKVPFRVGQTRLFKLT